MLVNFLPFGNIIPLIRAEKETHFGHHMNICLYAEDGEPVPEPTFDDVIEGGTKKSKEERALSVVSSGQRSIVEDTMKKQEEMKVSWKPYKSLKSHLRVNRPLWYIRGGWGKQMFYVTLCGQS